MAAPDQNAQLLAALTSLKDVVDKAQNAAGMLQAVRGGSDSIDVEIERMESGDGASAPRGAAIVLERCRTAGLPAEIVDDPELRDDVDTPTDLEAVLEHNRLDLVSLAGLTARLLMLVSNGPEATDDEREVLALGRVYERAEDGERAGAAYARAEHLARRAMERGERRRAAGEWAWTLAGIRIDDRQLAAGVEVCRGIAFGD